MGGFQDLSVLRDKGVQALLSARHAGTVAACPGAQFIPLPCVDLVDDVVLEGLARDVHRPLDLAGGVPRVRHSDGQDGEGYEDQEQGASTPHHAHSFTIYGEALRPISC